MKIPALLGFLLLIVLFIHSVAEAQIAPPARIVILPFHNNGVDSVTVQTAESILRTEISKVSSGEIVSAKRTRELPASTTCAEADCAIEIGKSLEASKVLGCQLSALGTKIIVQYFLVDVRTGKQVIVDQTTALTAEDLEVLMKRIARSVVDVEPVSKGAEVGNILVTESTEPLRRASRKGFGLSFGYLYPQSGYDNSDRSFNMDGRFDYEINDYAAGMLLGIRKGFAVNLYGSYLLSRQDFCPYVGGAFGFHWVSHSNSYTYGSTRTDLKSDGFELTAHAGIRVLHTYNVQFIINLDYIYTMNDYNDRALVLTLGIL